MVLLEWVVHLIELCTPPQAVVTFGDVRDAEIWMYNGMFGSPHDVAALRRTAPSCMLALTRLLSTTSVNVAVQGVTFEAAIISGMLTWTPVHVEVQVGCCWTCRTRIEGPSMH